MVKAIKITLMTYRNSPHYMGEINHLDYSIKVFAEKGKQIMEFFVTKKGARFCKFWQKGIPLLKERGGIVK